MVELLVPAGSLRKAKFAFAYGADAIYVGIPIYSLRGKENKFTLDEEREIIDYAHSLGKKVYVTTNIYFHNFKLPGFEKHLDKIMELNPDALIVADPGALNVIRRKYPEAEIHLSVQANSTNYEAVDFWRQNGVSRVIMPRELTLDEIRETKRNTSGVELEAFIHGSICVAYSGRCLLSNYMTYRDANQGICNNSCRWKYRLYKASGFDESYEGVKDRYFLEEVKREGELLELTENSDGSYILNSKDLCAVEYIKDLMEAGVSSLKIEGRNKSEYYVAVTTRAYRKTIDEINEGKTPDYETMLKELNTVSNRAYIPGFFAGNLMEKAQNYEHSSMYTTHCFAGIVVDQQEKDEKTEVSLELRNRIMKGDTLEFVMPYSDEIKSFEVDKIMVEGEEVDKFSPGAGKLAKLEVPFAVSEFCVVRKRMNHD